MVRGTRSSAHDIICLPALLSRLIFYLQPSEYGFVKPTECDEVEVTNVRCHFSDGGEAPALGRGPHTVLIRLREGEAIRSVVALWTDNPTYYDPLPNLVGISLKTSHGRELTVEPKHNREDWHCRRSHLNKSESHIPEGRELRSIRVLPGADREYFRFIRLETVPIGKGVAVPTLASLAHDGESARLQQASRAVEARGKARLEAARAAKDEEVGQIVLSARAELQSSSEAANVRRLQAELLKAQDSLQERARRIQTAVDEKISRAKSAERNKRVVVKNEWRAERDASIEEHQAFLDLADRLGSDEREPEAILCQSPNCRRVYDTRDLNVHQLCSAPECRSWQVNCGCEVDMCARCSGFFCTVHLPGHVEECLKREDDEMLRQHENLCSASKFDFDPTDFDLDAHREARMSLDVVEATNHAS